jgi:8-oxo-dGTP diphosphatase
MAEATPIAIAVVEHDGRFLVGRRGADSVLAGCWEFPGGKIRPAEAPSAAAERECLEETGLRVRAEKLLTQTRHAYAHGAVELHFFACRLMDVDAAPRAPFCWTPRGELAALELPAANHRVLELLLARDALNAAAKG